MIGEEEEFLARLGACSMFSPMSRAIHYDQRGNVRRDCTVLPGNQGATRTLVVCCLMG